MPNYSRSDVILVRYPFSDLSGAKVRPATIVSGQHTSNDLIVVPLTSRTAGLLAGEFVLSDYRAAGLNVATAVKRGCYTIEQRLVLALIGHLPQTDTDQLNRVLLYWLGYQPAP